MEIHASPGDYQRDDYSDSYCVGGRLIDEPV
jgi:hypothetical protein